MHGFPEIFETLKIKTSLFHLTMQNKLCHKIKPVISKFFCT